MEQKSSKSTARDVFFYLFMAVLLTWSVVSLSALIWQYINFSFPDTLQFSYQNITDVARNAMAGLIITWPVFILVSWMIEKDLTADHSKIEIWVRKWLLYLTLFVCAIVSIVDLVMLLNNFLSGEITIRFALKASTILAVAISVFTYYLWELRRTLAKKDNTQMITAISSSIVVLIAIVAGFFIIGTPVHQRAVRMDQQRISDLQGIQSSVLNYWQQKEKLPDDLTKLNDSISGYMVPKDPITGATYEYSWATIDNNPLSFTLCANFQKKSLASDTASQYTNPYYPTMAAGKTPDSWAHEAGRGCFDRTIDPDLYGIQKDAPVGL